MTSEQRSNIGNAIWICSDHAVLIDRDEVTFSVEVLRMMKRERENTCEQELHSGTPLQIGGGLFAVGNDVIFTGDVHAITASSWTVDVRHFIAGDAHTLVTFIDRFSQLPAEAQYLLSNELGDGRLLTGAPTLKKENSGYRLNCPVATASQRVDVTKLG